MTLPKRVIKIYRERRDYNMWLEMDVGGIKVKLKIDGYETSTKDTWDSQWCNCSFLFVAGDWLNLHREDDEILLSSEIEELEAYLTELLTDKLSEVKEFTFVEPDFVFILHPKKDIRNDPKYVYVRPGYEIEDVYLEWKIFIWDGGLTDNYVSITLSRKEVVFLRDYLLTVMKKDG